MKQSLCSASTLSRRLNGKTVEYFVVILMKPKLNFLDTRLVSRPSPRIKQQTNFKQLSNESIIEENWKSLGCASWHIDYHL